MFKIEKKNPTDIEVNLIMSLHNVGEYVRISLLNIQIHLYYIIFLEQLMLVRVIVQYTVIYAIKIQIMPKPLIIWQFY